MKKLLLIGMCLVISFLLVTLVLAQTDVPEDQLEKIEGTASVVDLVGSLLVVDTGGDELSFKLADSAKIIRNGEEVSLNDINQNDQVTVVYYDNKLAGLKAVRVTVDVPPDSP